MYSNSHDCLISIHITTDDVWYVPEDTQLRLIGSLMRNPPEEYICKLDLDTSALSGRLILK